MQEIVSNSSPLIHLAKMGKLNLLYLLYEFFGRIIVPNAVYEECIVSPYNEFNAINFENGYKKLERVIIN